ncbi:MAG: hypothetical protein OXH51_03750 [Gemmatimonadetes bacterium]|nr:hypothetical protein [Gemmatimonadota bacterium]MDE2669709.1 hypothetical protein [Chloroflexota bacterium]
MPSEIEPPGRPSSLMGVASTPAVAALFALAVGFGQDEAAGQAVFTPEVIGTAVAPWSETHGVTLLAGERIACTIDSYEGQIHCLDMAGTVVGVFGREGEGPGEFGSPASLARGEEGTVGVADLDLGRFTVFEPTGAYLTTVRLPGTTFSPTPSFGEVLSGVSFNFGVMMAGGNSGTLMTRFDVNVASGQVVREEASPRGPWDVECEPVIWGTPDRDDGWVFVACEGHLVFVGDSGDAIVVQAPAYVPELPDDRDVARREEELVVFYRGLESLGISISGRIADRLKSYRATPKLYRLGTRHQLFDAANRYWIATRRDLHEWSYLDVYENAAYLGSVKVRDRLMAFDLVGSTLVVLVERQVGSDDADGIPNRALDWYDVGDLRFGTRP